MKLLRTAALPLALALALPACGAMRSLDTAARSLDTFELQPLAGAPARARTGRSLAVEVPTSSGALATERKALARTSSSWRPVSGRCPRVTDVTLMRKG